MTKNLKQFKKGDSVICDDYGIGYVIDVSKNPDDLYPVAVELQSDNSIISYTLDGRSVVDTDITLHHDNHNWIP